MKPKRAKAVRKRMASYCHTFGFKEPYRVLCDGNFIQAALDFKLYLKEHMPKALIGRCNMVTSNCIRAELKSLGDDVSGASLVAKRFECIRCKCAKGTAADCIKNLVGKDNAEHFVVATQDQALRMFLRHTPGVPVVVVARGEIILEGASKETVAFTAKHEADKNAPDDKERKALERKRKILDGEEVVAAMATAILAEKDTGDGVGGWLEGKVEQPPPRRRKGPKGVNPLAMKKATKVSKGGKGQIVKKKRQHRKKSGKGDEGGGG